MSWIHGKYVQNAMTFSMICIYAAKTGFPCGMANIRVACFSL